MCLQQRLGVAAQAYVGVDEHRVRSGQRRCEQLQHATEHDRNVTVHLSRMLRQRPSYPHIAASALRTAAAVDDHATDPTHAGSQRADPCGQAPIRFPVRGL
ncbi:hypothetical protein TBS_03800 [Thermobispora bispora]